MGIIANLLSTSPTGFWPKIINFFSNSVHNYAFGIILLTLTIKLVMLPIDFFNRKSTLKNAEITKTLQPQIDKIKQTYKDPQIQNTKIKEIYDKNQFNPVGLCLPMFICLTISMVIFFTLFSGLNTMANYKIINQYEQLQIAYVSTIDPTAETQLNTIETQTGKTQAEISAEKNALIISLVKEIDLPENQNVKTQAMQNVQLKYNEIKDSFLWIKNVWVSDTPWAKAIPSYSSYVNLARLSEDEKNNEENELVYNNVMGTLLEQNQTNGYLILTILTALSTVFAQYLSSKSSKNKESTQNQPNPNKGMMLIFPIIMGIFTLLYNSVFSIYILVGQLFSVATTPLITKLVYAIEKKNAQKNLNNSNRMKRI